MSRTRRRRGLDFQFASASWAHMDHGHGLFHMGTMKKVATNIPAQLLEEAVQIAGLNQTQTLIAGDKRRRLIDLRGKLYLNVDTHRTRRRRKV